MPPELGNAIDKRHTEFIVGRLCCREAISSLTGIPMIPAMAEDRTPRWPEFICGSISHSVDVAIAIVASTRDYSGLGIDIEKIMPEQSAQNTHHRILNEHEVACFNSDYTFAQQVTLIFSVKEALYKSLYPLVKKSFYFRTAEVIRIYDDSVILRLTKNLSDVWQAGQEIRVEYSLTDDWACAVSRIHNK